MKWAASSGVLVAKRGVLHSRLAKFPGHKCISPVHALLPIHTLLYSWRILKLCLRNRSQPPPSLPGKSCMIRVCNGMNHGMPTWDAPAERYEKTPRSRPIAAQPFRQRLTRGTFTHLNASLETEAAPRDDAHLDRGLSLHPRGCPRKGRHPGTWPEGGPGAGWPTTEPPTRLARRRLGRGRWRLGRGRWSGAPTSP